MIKTNGYSIPIIGAMLHTETTREILSPKAKERKQSEFIRSAILDFAYSKSFILNENVLDIRPKYITDRQWQKIQLAHGKSYRVLYNYAVAFYWLMSLKEFEGYNKSKLMKTIIENHQ